MSALVLAAASRARTRVWGWAVAWMPVSLAVFALPWLESRTGAPLVARVVALLALMIGIVAVPFGVKPGGWGVKPAVWRSAGTAAGIELVVPERVGVESGIVLSPIDPQAVARVHALIETELGRHPAALLRQAGLVRVALGKNLWSSSKRVVGAAVPGQGWLALDVEADERTLRVTIHHEIFHLVDRHRFGDTEWEATNPDTFRYRDAPRTGQAKKPPPPVRKGFVSRYARASAAEDKAELFAHLVLDREKTTKLAEDDAVLAAKVGLLDRRLGAVVALR